MPTFTNEKNLFEKGNIVKTNIEVICYLIYVTCFGSAIYFYFLRTEILIYLVFHVHLIIHNIKC